MQTTINPIETDPDTSIRAQFKEVLGEIYDTIDRVGQHLEKTFHTQEDVFLEEYRKQMYSAQKNLREYTKTHSQAELTKKIEEKERTLRAQREKALEETLAKSNKLKNFQTQAANLKNALKTLEDDINFIDDQTILSEEKNNRLNEEAKYLKLEILKLQPDFEFWEEDPQENTRQSRKDNFNRPSIGKSYTNYLLNSVDSGKRSKTLNLKAVSEKRLPTLREGMYRLSEEGNIDAREMERLVKQYKQENRNYEMLKRINEDPAFQKGKFEEIFEDCIKKALERNVENSRDKLPMLSKSVDGRLATQDLQEGVSQADTNLNADTLKLSEMTLSAQDKKVMIEEFLTSKDVKEYLYKKFIEESKKKTGTGLL